MSAIRQRAMTIGMCANLIGFSTLSLRNKNEEFTTNGIIAITAFGTILPFCFEAGSAVMEDRAFDVEETGKGIYSAMLMTVVPLVSIMAICNLIAKN